MDSINYIGEHLLPRQLGHFAILLSFVAALVSAVAYFMATQKRNQPLVAKGWNTLARGAFLTHGAAVFTAIGTIFYVMLNKYYEFQYVQAHVSEELQPRYVFSAFWEGQEGSFLLWMFWHVVLGTVILFTAKKWESPVLSVISSVQAVIGSMLLGVYIGFGDLAIKFGSNPLLLLREVFDAPIFKQADYVELLPQIAQGLNPSLQNYWMTIHPPTLFLGFASTVVPFAFAIAGLWTKDHKNWLRPALHWTLFSTAVLGTGILMGGAWAYEALNFGGYWAWDPVENTSLVPWIILVAGLHTNLIAKSTGQGIRATYIYYLLGFLLIVYSTFLTRSGILGDTSVHAFTEMGLESQLLFFLFFFIGMAVVALIWRWRGIPVPQKEEATSSKEFWMFIGSLTLLMSAVLITGATSLPVVNTIAEAIDPAWLPLALDDPEAHHNRFQLYIGVFIGLLSGFSQFLRWREKSGSFKWKPFLIHLSVAIVGALALTALTLTWIDARTIGYKILVFSGWFTVVSNLDYLISFARKDLKAAGSAVAHFGFGIMIIGIMASGPNQRVISKNTFLMEGLTADEELKRTTLLLFKDQPMAMENYRLQYTGDTLVDFTRTFFVDYEKLDADGQVTETFKLEPTVLYTREFDDIAITNPSTKRYWNKDIFTVIMSLPQEETSVQAKQEKEDSLKYRLHELYPGNNVSFYDTTQLSDLDTNFVDDYRLELLSFSRHAKHPDYIPEPNDLGISVDFRIQRSRNRRKPIVETGQAAIILRDGLLYQYPAQLNEINTRVKIDESIFDQLLVDENTLDYKEIKVKPGETFTVDGQEIFFASYDPKPEVDHYLPMKDDIAVGAQLVLKSEGEEDRMIEPIFVIRDKQAVRARDEDRELGIYANFVNLDPQTNIGTFFIAKAAPRPELNVPLAVATKSARADWISLQAIEFPGINLFWAGSILMLFGLALSMIFRLMQKRSMRVVQ
ncbi:cytochrome c assembly protein [Lewinellaceae bacterium SD302]|nr:cytochrome c assembly protein [Lewinellaceae bacterium SD302]